MQTHTFASDNFSAVDPRVLTYLTEINSKGHAQSYEGDAVTAEAIQLFGMGENTVIIGHSLGGVFALRVLEKLKKSIKAAFFVGTPIGIKPILNYDRDVAFSGFDIDWQTIKQKAKHFDVYQSDDDPYVGLGNGEELAKQLEVKLSFVPNAGHFNERAGYTQFEDLRDKVAALL